MWKWLSLILWTLPHSGIIYSPMGRWRECKCLRESNREGWWGVTRWRGGTHPAGVMAGSLLCCCTSQSCKYCNYKHIYSQSEAVMIRGARVRLWGNFQAKWPHHLDTCPFWGQWNSDRSKLTSKETLQPQGCPKQMLWVFHPRTEFKLRYLASTSHGLLLVRPPLLPPHIRPALSPLPLKSHISGNAPTFSISCPVFSSYIHHLGCSLLCKLPTPHLARW